MEKINLNNTIVVTVKYFNYKNGRKGFSLYDKNNLLLMRVTINLDNLEVLKNEVIIKDYYDNKGIYKLLLNSKFIIASHKKITVGKGQAYLCMLNNNYKFKK